MSHRQDDFIQLDFVTANAVISCEDLLRRPHILQEDPIADSANVAQC